MHNLSPQEEVITVLVDGDPVTVRGIRLGFASSYRERAERWAEVSIYQDGDKVTKLTAVRSKDSLFPTRFEVAHLESIDDFLQGVDGRQLEEDIAAQIKARF